MIQFRIDYVIMRRQDGEDNYTEIGFGSSGAWSDVDRCAHMVESTVQNREWETEPGMPEPDAAQREETVTEDCPRCRHWTPAQRRWHHCIGCDGTGQVPAQQEESR